MHHSEQVYVIKAQSNYIALSMKELFAFPFGNLILVLNSREPNDSVKIDRVRNISMLPSSVSSRCFFDMYKSTLLLLMKAAGQGDDIAKMKCLSMQFLGNFEEMS